MTPMTLEEKKEIILDIMKDVDKFCRENGLRYSLSSGTLLGAVRHGGFIPWDDDADMFMLREDYDRFEKIYKSDKYRLHSHNDEPEIALNTGYIKISDPTTFIAAKKGKRTYGVYVDIFPVDAVPEEPKAQREHMHKLMSIHNRLYHRGKKDIVSILKAHRHSMDWWWNKLDKAVHEGKYDDSPLVAHAVGSTNYRTVFPRAWFDSLKEIEFEGYKFFGFADTHAYLSMVFGEDYMTPRQWAHNYISYRE